VQSLRSMKRGPKPGFKVETKRLATLALRRTLGRDPETPIRSLRCQYESRARQRGVLFALSFETVKRLFASACHYCGAGPSNLYKNNRHRFLYNGIDRVNNSKGYTEGNSVACCKLCNLMKRALSAEDFLAHVARIFRHGQENNDGTRLHRIESSAIVDQPMEPSVPKTVH
jgi:hypothetical protein